MKRKILLPLISLSLFLVIVVGYNNCGQVLFSPFKQYSTSTGNPMNPTQTSSEILFAICSVLDRCQAQVPMDICLSGVKATSGIGPQLGLPGGMYNPFSSLESAESSGQILASPVATNACTDTINNLECDNPNVVNAYDPTSPNPFSGVPNMISTQACNHVFTPIPIGVSLEVPIEMNGQGLASSTTPTTFSRTRTTLNTSDYDGIVTYAFEVVATNYDRAPKNVYLVDATGITVATIAVPASASWNPTRLRSTFAATSGPNDYRIELDGTTSANQLQVWVGRMLVDQIGATETKVFVPLVVGGYSFLLAADDSTASIDNTSSASYSQPSPNWWVLWQKHDAAFSQLASSNSWTFEAVLSSDAGSTVSASIFDASTGLQVSPSEVSSTSGAPTLVSVNFADSAANFTDLDNMEVQIKELGGGGGISGYIYRAGIWIKLTNLTHAEVYYRNGFSDSWQVGYNPQDRPEYRTLPDISLFSNPISIYSELTSYVTSPGTSCADSLFDNGQNDSGVAGTQVSGSTFNVSSPILNRQRTSGLSVPPGDRFTYFVTPIAGSGQCRLVSTFFVIGF